MREIKITGTDDFRAALNAVEDEAFSIMSGGKVAHIFIADDPKQFDHLRSIQQNRLVYAIYKRIADTLYGGDVLLSRRECKLSVGCPILYKSSLKFARVYDNTLRIMERERRLQAMDLISVSSIMSTAQCTKYIKAIIQKYSENGVYFLDIEGIEDYQTYREFNRAETGN